MLTHTTLLALKKDFSDALLCYEPGRSFEQHKWEFSTHNGRVWVQSLRGAVFEKACVSEITAMVTLPNRKHETKIEWLGVQVFPASPLVPMLTAVFEQIQEQGELRCPGFFDVYPVVSYQEDRLDLNKQIGAVCRKYGRSYPDLPESYMKMYQVPEPGMGVGYGVGLALSGQETAQDFYSEAAQSIFSGYFQIVDRRKDSAFSHQQAADMLAYRSDMVKFVFMENRFFKGGVQLGIPAESFMLHMLPPTVRF